MADGERISVNLSGWNAVASRVINSNNEISPSLEVEFGNNCFQNLEGLVTAIEDVGKLVDYYREAVMQEANNMKEAGRVMHERDQADQVEFERGSASSGTGPSPSAV